MQQSQNYNEDLNKLIAETKIISMELFEQFYEAYSYDSVTTHNWLVNKLRIIKDRLDKGELIMCEKSGRILDKTNFLEWVEIEFPNTQDALYSL